MGGLFIWVSWGAVEKGLKVGNSFYCLCAVLICAEVKITSLLVDGEGSSRQFNTSWFECCNLKAPFCLKLLLEDRGAPLVLFLALYCRLKCFLSFSQE